MNRRHFLKKTAAIATVVVTSGTGALTNRSPACCVPENVRLLATDQKGVLIAWPLNEPAPRGCYAITKTELKSVEMNEAWTRAYFWRFEKAAKESGKTLCEFLKDSLPCGT